MKLLLTINLVFLSSVLCAQLRFNTLSFKKEKSVSVNISDIVEAYKPEIRYLEPVFPGGQARKINLNAKKKLVEQIYPRIPLGSFTPRNDAAPFPLIIKSFEGNSGNGSPLDNHVAVSEDGQIVSIINFNISVFDQNGSMLLDRNLNDFTASLRDNEFRYDPKVIYDSVFDRFIMVMISGFECNNSSVIIAFSQTNDATGNWNLYQIDGCPLDDETWADYPMISDTDNELILTVNQIENSGTWKDNFEESLIWRIEKESGYSGNDLEIQLFSNIEYNGRTIRNICPVKNGFNSPNDDVYFLSNKALDIRNDSIWIIELKNLHIDSLATLKIDVRKSDTPYGLPPNAMQPGGSLQTNDARILDAIIVDDWIQFVSTSIDTLTGQSAIYHGVINKLNSTRDISAQILSGDTEYAFPSIAFTGEYLNDSDVIILASHSSSTRNPGLSCLYVDSEGNYSDWLTIKEGEGTITKFSNTVRWGDYTASQRLSTPGHVFVTSSYGKSDSTYGTFLAELASPGLTVGTTAPERIDLMTKKYPNPSKDIVNIQFYTPLIERQKIALYDFQGRLVKLFHEGKPKKTGPTEFIFSTESLSKGVYYLVIIGDGQLLVSEKIVAY